MTVTRHCEHSDWVICDECLSPAEYLRSLKTGFGIEPADRARLLRIADSFESLSCTVKRIYADKLPGAWFVCGEAGANDANGLPGALIVCPAYGSDATKIYRRFDAPASVDTLPKGRDAKQGSVGTKGSAVPKGDAQEPSTHSFRQAER